MKKITFLAFLIVSSLFISCSEDENTSNPTVDETESFTYASNGTNVPITAWSAVRSGDTFAVVGTAADGSTVNFDFNTFGDLAKVSAIPDSESSAPWLQTFYEYTSHYFDFDIVAIDEAAKIIKVTYSGNLYEQEFDLTSPSTSIEGGFNLHFTDVTPQIPGLGFSADINGETWHSVKSSVTVLGDNNVTLDFNSDDAYKFALSFPHDEITVGTYAFTASSPTKMMISRYDADSGVYIDYNGSGTLEITDISNVGIFEIYSGTFSFTATNPENNSQISITNGTFKTTYNY